MGTRASLLHRLTASAERLDADDLTGRLADRATRERCVPVRGTARGEVVTVIGRLRSVRYEPGDGVPTLQAELYDGTDVMLLVWLGRRRIAGIEPGRHLLARARVGERDRRPAMFNPWYELLAPS